MAKRVALVVDNSASLSKEEVKKYKIESKTSLKVL